MASINPTGVPLGQVSKTPLQFAPGAGRPVDRQQLAASLDANKDGFARDTEFKARADALDARGSELLAKFAKAQRGFEDPTASPAAKDGHLKQLEALKGQIDNLMLEMEDLAKTFAELAADPRFSGLGVAEVARAVDSSLLGDENRLGRGDKAVTVEEIERFRAEVARTQRGQPGGEVMIKETNRLLDELRSLVERLGSSP